MVPLLLLVVICGGLFATPTFGQLGIGDPVEFRAYRDREFRDPERSPLETWDVPRFKGLNYFKINPAFKVTARFVRTPNEKKFNMPTSSGMTKVHVKYAEVRFSLSGAEHVLSVYQSEDLSQTAKYKNYLLIPFTDLTNGKETYGGGRYIDFEIPSGELVTLDFNLAYNPSCAYSSRFSCPLPPRENKLKTRIRAGEKTYIKAQRLQSHQSLRMRPTLYSLQTSKGLTLPQRWPALQLHKRSNNDDENPDCQSVSATFNARSDRCKGAGGCAHALC